MSSDFLDIIIRLLAALFVGIVAYLAPKISSYIKVNGESLESKEFITLISYFVQAADQLLKDDDPTGEKRMDYVIKNLESLGYEVTNTVISMIEGAVWKVNRASIDIGTIVIEDENSEKPVIETDRSE